MIETVAANAPIGTQNNFYRTTTCAEIDPVLTLPGQRLWAIEIKRSLTPKVEKGFHSACQDLNPERRIVVYPGSDLFPLADGVEAMPLPALGRALAGYCDPETRP